MPSYDIPIMTEAEFLRFRSKTQRLENGCLIWTGVVNKWGYGRGRLRGKYYFAHRLSFARWYGCTRATQLHHRECANKACVEPTHIVATTGSINTRARSRTGLAAETL